MSQATSPSVDLFNKTLDIFTPKPIPTIDSRSDQEFQLDVSQENEARDLSRSGTDVFGKPITFEDALVSIEARDEDNRRARIQRRNLAIRDARDSRQVFNESVIVPFSTTIGLMQKFEGKTFLAGSSGIKKIAELASNGLLNSPQFEKDTFAFITEALDFAGNTLLDTSQRLAEIRNETRQRAEKHPIASMAGETLGMAFDPRTLGAFAVGGAVAEAGVGMAAPVLAKVEFLGRVPELLNIGAEIAARGSVTGGIGFGLTEGSDAALEGRNFDVDRIVEQSVEGAKMGVLVGPVFELAFGFIPIRARVRTNAAAREVLGLKARGPLNAAEVTEAYRARLGKIEPGSEKAKEELIEAANAFDFLGQRSRAKKVQNVEDIVKHLDDIEAIEARTIVLNKQLGESQPLGRAKPKTEPKPEKPVEKPTTEQTPQEPSVLDSVVKAAEERMALRRRPSGVQGKGKPKGSRGGSAPIAGDIKDAAIIIAAKSAKIVIEGGKALRNAVDDFIKTRPELKGQAEAILTQIRKDAKKLVTDIRAGKRNVKSDVDPHAETFARFERVANGEEAPNVLLDELGSLHRQTRDLIEPKPGESPDVFAARVFNSAVKRVKKDIATLPPGLKEIATIMLDNLGRLSKGQTLTPAGRIIVEHRLAGRLADPDFPINLKQFTDSRAFREVKKARGESADAAEVGDLVAADAKEAADILDSIVEFGKNTSAIRDHQNARLNARNDTEIAEEAANSKTLVRSRRFRKRKEDKKTGGLKARKQRGTLRAGSLGTAENSNAYDTAEMIGGHALSTASRVFHRDLYMGRRAALKGFYKTMDGIYEFLAVEGFARNSEQLALQSAEVARGRKTFFGLDTKFLGRDVAIEVINKVKGLGKFNRDVNAIIHEVPLASGEVLKMTAMERVELLANFRAGPNRAAILKDGIVFKNTAETSPGFKITEADIQAIEASAAPWEGRFADELIRVLNGDLGDAYAEFSIKRFGHDNRINDTYYMERRRGHIEATSIDEIGAGPHSGAGLLNPSQSKARVGSKEPLVIGDALANIRSRAYQDHSLANLADPIARSNHVLKNGKTGAVLGDSIHPEFKDSLLLTNELMSKQAMIQGTGNRGVIDRGISKITGAVLVANPRVITYQGASLFNLMNSLGPRGLTTSTPGSFITKRVNRNNAIVDMEIREHSPYLRDRGDGASAIMDQNFARSTQALKGEAGVNTTYEFLTSGISAMDNTPVRIAWKMAKKIVGRENARAKTEGRPIVEGDQYWEQVSLLAERSVFETQPMFDILHRTWILNRAFSGKDLSARILHGTYRSALAQQQSQLRRYARRAVADHQSLVAAAEKGGATVAEAEAMRGSRTANVFKLFNTFFVNAMAIAGIAEATRRGANGISRLIADFLDTGGGAEPEENSFLHDAIIRSGKNASGILSQGDKLFALGEAAITKKAPRFDPDLSIFLAKLENTFIETARLFANKGDMEKARNNIANIIEDMLDFSGFKLNAAIKQLRDIMEDAFDELSIEPIAP